MASGTLSKYFQNQQRAVVDRQLQIAFEITLLCRTQGLIKKHLDSAMHLRERTNFISLSTSHKQCRVRGFALASDTSHRLETRRLGKQTKLFQLGVEMGKPQIYTNQDNGRC